MDLRQVRYFVTVADELHFGTAAARLYLSQGALSQAIQRLEREVGVQLLSRSSRNVRLTPAGTAFLEDARSLLRDADRMVERAQGISAGTAGSLAVGYTPSIAETVGRLLIRFGSDARGVLVSHRAEYSVRLVEAVAERTLDAAVVWGHQSAPGLDVLPFRDLPLVCWMAPGHPLVGNESVTLQDVGRHRVALPPDHAAPFWQPILARTFAREGLQPEFVPVDDPVGGAVPAEASRLLWLITGEHLLAGFTARPVEPPILVPFVLVMPRERESPTLDAFVEYLVRVRDAEGWLLARDAG